MAFLCKYARKFSIVLFSESMNRDLSRKQLTMMLTCYSSGDWKCSKLTPQKC